MLFRLTLVITALASVLGADKLPEWYTRTLENVEFDFRIVNDVKQIERIAGDRSIPTFTK